MEKLSRAPNGVFKGSNFMTPEPIAYYKRTLRGRTVYIEISAGEFNGRSLYGVTFRWDGGLELWREPHNPGDGAPDDPSAMRYSQAEALALAREAV